MHPFPLLVSLHHLFIHLHIEWKTKYQLRVYAQISLKSQVAVWLCLLYIKSTVSCFFINCQGPVVPHAPCQMEREATPALLLGAESLTPVTQGTWGLQVVLVEHVCQMANGQGVIQLVHVSPHHVILISFTYWLQTCKRIPSIYIVCTTIHSISKA